jgi:hypothetical protein
MTQGRDPLSGETAKSRNGTIAAGAATLDAATKGNSGV